MTALAFIALLLVLCLSYIVDVLVAPERHVTEPHGHEILRSDPASPEAFLDFTDFD